jgi:hypothetical protein
MKITEILAKLVGTKNEEAGEITAPALSAEELTQTATALESLETELSARNAELVETEAVLCAKETELTEKEVALAAKEVELTEKETALTTKSENLETEIAEKAQKLSVQGTEPVKPEGKDETSNILEAYANEKDPSKRFALFQKHEAVLRGKK